LGFFEFAGEIILFLTFLKTPIIGIFFMAMINVGKVQMNISIWKNKGNNIRFAKQNRLRFIGKIHI
jgi:hypothetical protein